MSQIEHYFLPLGFYDREEADNPTVAGAVRVTASRLVVLFVVASIFMIAISARAAQHSYPYVVLGLAAAACAASFALGVKVSRGTPTHAVVPLLNPQLAPATTAGQRSRRPAVPSQELADYIMFLKDCDSQHVRRMIYVEAKALRSYGVRVDLANSVEGSTIGLPKRWARMAPEKLHEAMKHLMKLIASLVAAGQRRIAIYLTAMPKADVRKCRDQLVSARQMFLETSTMLGKTVDQIVLHLPYTLVQWGAKIGYDEVINAGGRNIAL